MMDFSTAFFVSCILVLSYCTSLTSANAIPFPNPSSSHLETNSVMDTSFDTNLLLRLLNSASESSMMNDANAEVLSFEGGDDSPVVPSLKRSASTDINLSQQPAAFVVAEDLSGAELTQLLQGIMNQENTEIPASVRCSGQVVNQSTTTRASSNPIYASEVCSDDVIPAFDNSKPNTRGLCPWTYVENVDSNRYPSSILYAQCACPFCESEDRQREFNEYLGCQPIYHSVKVLRKHVCRGGIQIYESAYERIPVACACLRHPVAN